jgi:glycosyltransferase involved in cell wall biosynthesis
MTVWHLPHVPDKNPYGELFVRSLGARGIRVVAVPYRHLFALGAIGDRPDVLHFQFVAPYILPAEPSLPRARALVKGILFLVQVTLLRQAGCRIVWTVHDLLNHERRLAGLEWFFSLLFTRLAHLLIVHGEAARAAVSAAYRLQGREDRIAVVFHPNYIGAYPGECTREQARTRLGVTPSSLMILSIGQIRPYKGLPELLRAFAGLPGRDRAELWIAGEPVDRALAGDLQREARSSPRIRLRVGHQAPEDLDALMKACDIVALPYRHILTSGAALLAMSYGKPCVAPRLGCLEEVLDGRGAFLYDPATPDDLGAALARAVDSADHLEAMGRHNFAKASAWTWPRVAELLIDRYEGLLGRRTGTAAGSERA